MTTTTIDWTVRDWTQDLVPGPAPLGPLTEEDQYWADQAEVYDTPEYRAFEEAQYAAHIGAATPLTHCYLCEPDVNKRSEDAGPLRGIVSSHTTRGSDPYEALVLTCGHTII